jgi:hypothetical protein
MQAFIVIFLGLGFVFSLSGQTSVFTQHNDVGRTGQNLTETILTPASVSSGSFGKLFSLTVDGVVEAQPLYVSNLTVNGALHNVVFIATEHDSVYAFDADTGGTPLWQASLLDTAHGASPGATTDPQSETGCSIANGEYGISGTPVIDPATGTLYVISVTFENNYPLQRLHALDITTGAEKFGGPTVITAAVAATGTGSSNGILTFDPNLENPRAGLALVNGIIYAAFGGNCDFSNFHGWLLAYNASTLAQTAAFLTTPNGSDSGIWMGGAAPSFDTQNGVTRLFVTTGNGTYDATDYGDDILRLDLTNSALNVSDSFTPYDQNYLQSGDGDLGSSGTLILPDQPGNYPHLLVEASKTGVLYLVNRDNLGGYNATSDNVVQEILGQVGPSFGLPAYWNGSVYIWPKADSLKQFSLSNGLLSTTPTAVSPQVQASGIGSTPSISANGTANAIVWSINTSQSPQVLYAHDATNVASMLWSSATNAALNSAGPPVKFPVPTIANGKVYVGSNQQVSVYGLPDFALSAVSASLTLPPGQTTTDTVSISGLFGFNSSVSFSAAGLPAGVTVAFSSSGKTAVATFTAATTAAAGSYPITLTGVSGTLSHSVLITLVVTAVPDFSLTSALSSVSLSQGQKASDSLSIMSLSGFTGSVTLSASSLPSGVTAALSSTGVTFTATESAAPGSYPVTITGTSGALSHSVSLTLVVSAAPVAADFTMTTTPASLTLTAGTSGTSQIQLSPNATFAGNVALTCSVPKTLTNITCTVPATVAGGSGKVTLTVTDTSPAQMLPWRNRPLWPLLPLLIAVCAYGLTRPRYRFRTLAVSSAVLLLILAGCRGGGSSTSSASTSTADTSSETGQITVVGTSGSLSHTATVSITVQ